MRSSEYVVVGAGTAGSVLAARLSADPANRALLVDAGDPNGPALMGIPPVWPALIGSTADWGHATAPGLGVNYRAQPYPQGKVVGGGGGINTMVFLRRHCAGYDAWTRDGAASWRYADLPFFKRSERAVGRDPEYRGTDGPMRVSPPAVVSRLAHVYLDAAV